jgi:galactose-1-phosphate uridylyltransferase
MTPPIDFRVVESESRFLHPGKGFEETAVRFQVRVDPLTGRTGHFSHFGAVKPVKLPIESYSAPAVKGFCPFCLENRERTTPKFLPAIMPEGRLARNEAAIIPNLFPYDIYSSVVIMTDDHVVPLPAFSAQRLTDALSLGTDFLKKVRTLNGDLPYHLMCWNYMPPSGGGLVHPHQQYFATAFPGNQFMDELKASEAFFPRYGVSYWDELMAAEERLGERYIGAVGCSRWTASFVSMGLLGEILCVFPDVFSVEEFGDGQIEELVAGTGNIFAYFRSAGIESFNASLFFGPEGQRYFPCHFRIAARTFLNARDFAPDLNFFQALLAEPVSVVLPEDLCRDVKPYFS